MSKIGKRAILLLLALPIGFNVMAQETKKPTLEELIPGGESYRYAENLYGLQWWGDECIKPGVHVRTVTEPARLLKRSVRTAMAQVTSAQRRRLKSQFLRVLTTVSVSESRVRANRVRTAAQEVIYW